MSAAERSESAKKAAEVRWSSEPVREVLAGSPDHPLRIGEVEIECYVLDDDTRVITQASMLTAIGRSRRIPGAEGASVLDHSVRSEPDAR
ncbi:phage-related protein [Leifsonia xyli subsp. xyli str. CTCB07]|uniref:Phage-related protein n=2 Tax=Leifsonia xyli TaxID=1575 RepID=Q6AGX6_LEIXX|nr:phage-related protein [Leifsonia xyli subsp. xyli str. CTCB07]